MSWIDILIIVITILVIALIIAHLIYKKIKGLPSEDCCSCKNKGNKLISEYNKKYNKNIKLKK